MVETGDDGSTLTATKIIGGHGGIEALIGIGCRNESQFQFTGTISAKSGDGADGAKEIIILVHKS